MERYETGFRVAWAHAYRLSMRISREISRSENAAVEES